VKDSLSKINKLLENRIRLAIMSLLIVEEHIDFNAFKETLDLTDGNLASHMAKLEEAGYVQVEKRFQDRKPQTRYQATESGRTAFRDHLSALEAIIRGST
jgi:DNA-binding transcriptional ArsR family regulator